MTEFDLWFNKLLFNLDDGNLREALYCSDMALYSAEREIEEPDSENLTKVYIFRAKTLELMGREEEARSCMKIVEDLKVRS